MISARPVLQETRAVPKATEAELRVRAVGLNFRDVLNVMGASGARQGLRRVATETVWAGEKVESDFLVGVSSGFFVGFWG